MRKTLIAIFVMMVLTLIYSVNNKTSIVYAEKTSLDEIDNSQIDLNELYMNINIPNDWVIFTRNVNDNDENLKLLGIDAQALKNQFINKKIFLNAVFLEPKNEIVVTMTEGFKSIYNFNDFTEKELENMAKDIVNSDETKKAGITYTNYSIYTQESVKYIVFDLDHQSQGDIVYGKQYYTVHNGQAINITLQSYSGIITDDFIQKQKVIVDSVNFTETFNNPNKKSKAYKTITGIKIIDKSLSTIIESAILGGIIGLFIFLRKKAN